MCMNTMVAKLRRCGSLSLLLGLLLFGWIGLLLGLLGADDVEIVCRNCGCRWRPGHRG